MNTYCCYLNTGSEPELQVFIRVRSVNALEAAKAAFLQAGVTVTHVERQVKS